MGVISIYNDYFNTLNVSSISSFETVSTIMIHEAIHCFGYSNSAFESFVNPTTNAILGTANVYGTTTARGKTVNFIKLAAVLAYAKTYFNCPSIFGVELEDEGGDGTAGSHWERRVV